MPRNKTPSRWYSPRVPDDSANPGTAAEWASRGSALLGDPAREADATACFEQALALDPENTDAGEPLAEILVHHGEWARVAPILDMLLRRFRGKRGAEQLRPLHLGLAEAAERLGRPADAIRWLRVAHQTRPDGETVRRLADLHFARGEIDDAFAHYQMLLVQHGDRLKPADRVHAYERIGRIKWAAKDRVKARNMWEKALALDSRHRPTLEAFIELLADDGEHDRVVEFKRRIAEGTEPDERFALLREIAAIRRDRQEDLDGAIAAYLEALTIRPDDRDALVALFELYRQARQWAKAIETCLRIAERERDREQVNACHRFVAATYRDLLDVPAKAVEHFDRALDADPEDAASFEAIEALLGSRADWRGVEAAYLRMVRRLPAEEQAARREKLLHRAGEIARDRAGDFEAAERDFREAAASGPRADARRAVLADLFERMPGRWAAAAAEHEILLRADPKRLESYRALLRIYHAAGRADETWCVCAALAFLERAEPVELEFYERYRPKAAPAVRGALTPESWDARLRHPEEHAGASAVFAAAAPAIRRGIAHNAKDLGLRKQDWQDPASSPLAIARALRQAGSALGVALPELYSLPDQPGGLTFAPTDPPATVVARDVLSGFSPNELRFVAAKHLTCYRLEHQVPYLLAVVAAESRAPLPQVIGAYLRAAVHVGTSSGPPAGGAAVQAAARFLETNLAPTARGALAAAARKFLDGPTDDVETWLAGTELTGDRAGLLLCGDLAAATNTVRGLPPLSPSLTHPRRVDEMIAFSVSAAFFALRRELGIALAAAGTAP